LKSKQESIDKQLGEINEDDLATEKTTWQEAMKNAKAARK
jgi:hypothetical protein